MSSAAPKEAVDKEPCREEGAEVFEANSAVVLVRQVKDARGKAKYEVKVKRADDCAVVDLIPEITSPTARDVA
jgi:ribosomal protein S24E